MKYYEHFVSGGRYEIFVFKDRDEMNEAVLDTVNKMTGMNYITWKDNEYRDRELFAEAGNLSSKLSTDSLR